MKKLVVLASAAIVGLTMNAQRLDVGANFMLGMPMGDYNFGDASDQSSIPPGFGIGGGIEANYWFNDAFSAGLEVGFIAFGEQANDVDGLEIMSSGTLIPIIAKAEYHFLDDAFRPFVGLGVGYGMMAREFTFDFFGEAKGSWDQNGLIISPRAGMLYQVSDLIAINLSLQYNLMMNSVDGDLEMTVEMGGMSETDISEDMLVDATNYLGINIGLLFILFE